MFHGRNLSTILNIINLLDSKTGSFLRIHFFLEEMLFTKPSWQSRNQYGTSTKTNELTHKLRKLSFVLNTV